MSLSYLGDDVAPGGRPDPASLALIVLSLVGGMLPSFIHFFSR